jgi:hypothetical protein
LGIDNDRFSPVFNQDATNPPFEFHNFITTLSGPILIPKLCHGRNKKFFFPGYPSFPSSEI